MTFFAPGVRRSPAAFSQPRSLNRRVALTALTGLMAFTSIFAGVPGATAASTSKAPPAKGVKTKKSPAKKAVKSKHKTGVAVSKAPTVHWLTSLPEALQGAQKSHKPVLVDFYTTWCGPCKMLDQYTYPNAEFVRESRQWVMVKLDAEASPENVRAARTYQVTGYPTLAFMKSDGTLMGGAVGYWDAPGLIKLMREAVAKMH